MDQLNRCLKPGGKVITFDPLQTYGPMRFMRRLYRPFQTDREWEYPFGQKQLDQIKGQFQVKSVRGLMGRVKWAMILYMLSPTFGQRKGIEWLEHDWTTANQFGRRLYRCLQISMLLVKKENDSSTQHQEHEGIRH
jgi:hypothetical protein